MYHTEFGQQLCELEEVVRTLAPVMLGYHGKRQEEELMKAVEKFRIRMEETASSTNHTQVCACACVCVRESVSMCVCMCVRERGVCVSVCLCVRTQAALCIHDEDLLVCNFVYCMASFVLRFFSLYPELSWVFMWT